MAETQKLAREQPKFIVRFSEELRDKIKAAADENKRSMNAEVVRLIEQGFEQRAHDEWLEEQYREHMADDHNMQAVYEQNEREWEEVHRVQRATERAKRASPRFDFPEDETQPATLIVPPEGMLPEEFSELMERALKGSHRQAMELFKSMIVRKGGHVVPIEDTEDNP